jgi:hypothetical protein
MTSTNSPWIYKGEPIVEMPLGYEGFVYLITCPDGRLYIGQKKLTFKRTKIVGGKRLRKTVESDWQEYWSSSDEIKELVKKSTDGFKREILYLCQTKSAMNYIEACLIFSSGALLSDQYINKWVSTKINKSTIVGKIKFHHALPEFELIEVAKKTKKLT